LRRNEGRDRSVRNLVSDLPGDIASGFSDAIDDFVDVPARMAERYSRSHREGEESDRRRYSHDHDHDSDDYDHDRDTTGIATTECMLIPMTTKTRSGRRNSQ